MCVFHAFSNLASELSRFADRQFYNVSQTSLSVFNSPSTIYLQDWWASTSFSSYYRKWNTIVHDWIYSYLFLDLCAIFPSKLPAILSTLFLSAFMHEYVLAMALGFASPFLMIEFAGLGGEIKNCLVIIMISSVAVFYFMRAFASRRVANLIVLGSLSFGMANLIFYYTAEIAARTYCPRPVSQTYIAVRPSSLVLAPQLTLKEFFVPRMFECYIEQNSS